MAIYSIRKSRLKRSYIEGFILGEDGKLSIDPAEHYHVLFLPGLDGMEDGGEWGRFGLKAKASEGTMCSMYALALDNNDIYFEGGYVPLDQVLLRSGLRQDEKFSLLKHLGAERHISWDDMLLYGLSGRYLYIALEVTGNGEAELSGLYVDSQGDNFMQTFPEVYRERNSFFHRYMSVLSRIYQDMQREIESLPALLDLDSCPAQFLPLYGSWLGIDLEGGFLKEEVLRKLIKKGYELNKKKGTRGVLEEIAEAVLEADVMMIEHNMVRTYRKSDPHSIGGAVNEGGIYDVTLLVQKTVSEELMHQLMFILDQFKPLRTQIKLVQLEKNAIIDADCYLDINASIPRERQGELDSGLTVDGLAVLG